MVLKVSGGFYWSVIVSFILLVSGELFVSSVLGFVVRFTLALMALSVT